MYMNPFLEIFSSSLIQKTMPAHQTGYDSFIGKIYSINEKTLPMYMTIMSGGMITATYPYSYETSGLPYYCLFYTENGAGSIHVDGKIFTLSKNTLFLLHSDKPYHIDLTMAPWTYSVFFIQGDLFPAYFDFLTEKDYFFHKFKPYSSIPQYIKRISLYAGSNALFHKLSDAKNLTDIFTDLYNEVFPTQAANQIPSYIQEMYLFLDQSYQESFGLDDFEAHFNISKYRLCREFKKYYGEAPLTFLNHKRIHVAKELLTTSDLKIYEIGNAVGIENTNHFINLFKKNTGVTPLYYKKKHT